MELHAALDQFGHAHCGENTDFMGNCKALSWDCPCGTCREEMDREAVEGRELFHEPTGLLFNRQPFHSRDLFKKESFVKGGIIK